LGADTLVAAGFVIRYIADSSEPSPRYDVNITQTFTGRAFMDVIHVGVDAAVEVVGQGDPVLVIADPTGVDRTYAEGLCPAIQPIPISEFPPPS
jgi:hypothetical protein